MTKEEVTKFIGERKGQGASIYTIARELAEKGHVNQKTNKPLSYAGVDYIAKRLKGVKISSRSKKRHETPAPRTEGAPAQIHVTMVKRLAQCENVTPEMRLTLISNYLKAIS